MSEIKESSEKLELILVNALKIPGVKVDRKDFLATVFVDKLQDDEQLTKLLVEGPIQAGFTQTELSKVAMGLINKRTTQSASASFAAGLPGGLAMAATIPADVLQFFGVALKLAQELAYLYGVQDLWVGDDIDIDKVRNQLILFLGVMFGVGGANSALRMASSGLAKQALKKLPQKALTKTIYYPIIKKICASIGIKVTKDSFAKSVSKVIPVVGGVVSGGLTFVSMKPMGKRLKESLESAVFEYTQEDMKKDMGDLQKEMGITIDIPFEEDEKDNLKQGSRLGMMDEILRMKELLDMGAINQEEFNEVKGKLLEKISS